MRYVKFTSLDNTYRENIIERIRAANITHPDIPWMVTEKLHGANLGIYIDISGNIELASRLNMLGTEGKLYNARNVVKKYEDGIKACALAVLNGIYGLYNEQTGKFMSGVYMIMYGEIFGGSVQKNMPYNAEQDLAIFDTAIILPVEYLSWVEENFPTINKYAKGYAHVHDEEQEYIIVAAHNKIGGFDLFKSYGIPHVPVLHVGTFKECMEYENEFKSTLYHDDTVDKLLLPSEEAKRLRGIAEGVVIEPVEGLYLQQMRVYLKNRCSKFEKKKTNGPRVPKKQIFLDSISAKGHFVLERTLDKITEDRFESAVSKIGEVTIRDIHKVAGEMTQDIFEDFAKEELAVDGKPNLFMPVKEYLGNTFKPVQKHLFAEVIAFIKPFLLKE